MTRRSHDWVAAVGVVALLGSCAPSIDVPPAPDLQPVLEAYANPNAVVTSEIMGVVADEIAKAAEDIEDSEFFEQILEIIIEFQTELDQATAQLCSGGANDGNACTDDADCPAGSCGDILRLGAICNGGTNDTEACASDEDCPGGACEGGVILPNPTGVITLNYVCPGVDEAQFDPDYLKACEGGSNEGGACSDNADCPDGSCVEARPDSANGAIDLFMTLDSGGIGRVVWGTATQCLYLVPVEGDDCEAAGCSEASFVGSVALDLGPGWVDEDISELPVTFVVEGSIGFEGDDSPIEQSFRVVLAAESALVILVDIGDPASPAWSETFNYIFTADAQAIRDATGLFGCSLEERRCFDESGTLFSW